MHHFLGVPWLSTSTRIFTWIYWEGAVILKCSLQSFLILSTNLRVLVHFSDIGSPTLFFYTWIFSCRIGFFLSLSMLCSFRVICFIVWISHTFSWNWFFFLTCKKTTKVKALHKLNEKKWGFFLLKHLLHPQVCIIYQHLHVLNKTIFYTVLRIKGILFNCKNIASFIAVHHLL